jgi:lipid-binding SYLF domain-containing protein
MGRTICITVTVVALAALLVGCSTAPKSESDREALSAEVQATMTRFQKTDAGLKSFFSGAHGYAVFPSVGKGAVGVGGAYGKGEVFEKGTMIGWCDLSQATIGFQLGGQAYSEVIFFQTKEVFNRFTAGKFEFAAQASAVAATAGASADAPYRNGVAVFTMAQGGLMYEASIGGQKFSFLRKTE